MAPWNLAPSVASFDGVDGTTVNNDGVGVAFYPAPESRHFMSSISIIGLGNMASALAVRALAGGNAVEIIGRDSVKAKELAATLGGATVGTAGAVPAGDIVILAVPYAGAAAVVSEYGDALQGKVIVDITNPIASDFKSFVTPDGSSGAQEIAKAAPAGAHVVKAFNALFSNVLTASPAEGRPLDVFIAGDDAQAKARVSAFVESLGMRPMDTGQLPMARALENVGLLQLGLVTHSVKHANFFLGVTILS
jgi:predicted dinucleotide-binding enzyme